MDYQRKLGELLRKERESLDLTLTEVSKKMNFNHYQTLSSIEAGEREVKAFELDKLAEIYGRDIDYFLNLGTLEKKSRILWKSPEQSTQKSLLERQFLLICRRYQKLIELVVGEKESTYTRLKFKIDKHELISGDGVKYVEDLASHYSNLLNLGSRPACSLTKILEEKMGIKVIYLPMVSDISQGCTFDLSYGMAALINENNAPWRRSFDLCHTFFHLLTWNLFSEEEIHQNQKIGEFPVEKLADTFAAALLLPEKELRDEFEKRILEKSISYLDLVQLARKFNVPFEALIQRLVHLELLDNEKFQKNLEKDAFLDFDKKYRYSRWAEASKPHLSSRFISLAIKAYLSDKITRDKMADYLDVSSSTIPAFIRKYGYEETENYCINLRTN